MVEKSQVDKAPPFKETNTTNSTYYYYYHQQYYYYIFFFNFPITQFRCACEASIISHATIVGSFHSLATLSPLFSCQPPTLERFLNTQNSHFFCLQTTMSHFLHIFFFFTLFIFYAAPAAASGFHGYGDKKVLTLNKLKWMQQQTLNANCFTQTSSELLNNATLLIFFIGLGVFIPRALKVII